ncbi:MAG: hypothetical protein AAF762_07865, partial [Pseudomonadota bacterium]
MEIDAALDAHLNESTSTVESAMRYAALGGKKLRGFLVLESAALHDVPRNVALQAAVDGLGIAIGYRELAEHDIATGRLIYP